MASPVLSAILLCGPLAGTLCCGYVPEVYDFLYDSVPNSQAVAAKQSVALYSVRQPAELSPRRELVYSAYSVIRYQSLTFSLSFSEDLRSFPVRAKGAQQTADCTPLTRVNLSLF